MRVKRILAALLAAALGLALLAGCGSASGSAAPSAPAENEDELQRYETVFFDVFDTVTQVIAYCASQEEFNAQMEALHADLAAYNQLYDIYNDYEGVNNLKAVNDNAGVAPVAVDARILDMLEEAKEVYALTDGRTNVAMGSVLRLWHDCREAAEADPDDADNVLPDPDALAVAAQHCNIEDVILDREAGTVYLADPAMSLDVGSIGKGYAVEQVCQAAEARGLTRASVSVGGNLRSMGEKPGAQPWLSGVASPWEVSEVYTSSSAYIATVYTSDLALVTSGNYQRYYTVDGVRYHHLIDPDTLYPADYFTAVTILCGDSGLADGLSTGLFCMPLEQGQALVESLDGVEALWCTEDGQIIYSSGFLSHAPQS